MNTNKNGINCIKCGDCKCLKLPEYFSLNVRGVLYKTCNNCRMRHKCGQKGCDFSINSKTHLDRHLWSVHDISTSDKYTFFNCEEKGCKAKFKEKEKLQRHLWGVHDISSSNACKLYECQETECNSVFKSLIELQRHLWSIHNISSSTTFKFRQCSQCDSKFKTLGELNLHLWNIHDISISNAFKFHQCNKDKCNAKFKTVTHLNEHLWNIHDISTSNAFKFHSCDKEGCNAKFKTPSHLRRHQETCTGLNTSISGLEFKCIEALTDLGFIQDEDFIYNHSYHKLTEWSGKVLRPDIRFLNHKIMIELDGSQHYKPKNFGGISQERAEENFKLCQENDKLKNDFCDKFEYKMIRVKYTDIVDMLGILHYELMDIL